MRPRRGRGRRARPHPLRTRGRRSLPRAPVPAPSRLRGAPPTVRACLTGPRRRWPWDCRRPRGRAMGARGRVEARGSPRGRCASVVRSAGRGDGRLPARLTRRGSGRPSRGRLRGRLRAGRDRRRQEGAGGAFLPRCLQRGGRRRPRHSGGTAAGASPRTRPRRRERESRGRLRRRGRGTAAGVVATQGALRPDEPGVARRGAVQDCDPEAAAAHERRLGGLRGVEARPVDDVAAPLSAGRARGGAGRGGEGGRGRRRTRGCGRRGQIVRIASHHGKGGRRGLRREWSAALEWTLMHPRPTVGRFSHTTTRHRPSHNIDDTLD